MVSSSSSSEEESTNPSDLLEMSLDSWEDEEDDFYDLRGNWSAEPAAAASDASASSRAVQSPDFAVPSSRARRPRHSWRGLDRESSPQAEYAFGERLAPSPDQDRVRGHSMLREMVAAQHARIRIAARSPSPSRRGTGSGATRSRQGPPRSTNNDRRPSTLRQITEHQQQWGVRSATVTAPSSRGRSSYGDGLLIVIPPEDRATAEDAARMAPRPYRTTSGRRRVSDAGSSRTGSSREPSSSDAPTVRTTRSSSRHRAEVDSGQQSEPPIASTPVRAAAARTSSRGVSRRL